MQHVVQVIRTVNDLVIPANFELMNVGEVFKLEQTSIMHLEVI